MEELNKMTVPQLKTECTNRGLDVTGKKAELVERLNAHEKNADAVVEVPDDDDDVVEVPDDDEGDAKDEDGDVKDEDGDAQAEDGDAQDEDGDAQDEDGDAQDEEMTLVDTAEGDDDDGEDNADDVIGAIDSYMEENEDKKDADGKDKEGKKDDKKESPKKTPKVKVPNKKVVRTEFQQETRVRTVVFGPLEIEDLKGEEMLEYLKGAEQFFVRFATSGKTGHVQLRMKTFEEAKVLVETMTSTPFKEGLVIKQLGPDDGGNVDSILKGETDKNLEKFDLRMLYVHNVPESATEDALKALVPEALSACIPKDQDRKPKGYAFLEFETEAKVDEIHKKVSDLTLDGKNLTLHHIPNADYNRRGSFGNRNYGGNRGGGNRNNRQDNRGYQNRDRGRSNYGGNRSQGGRNWSGGNVRPLLGQQQGGGNWGGNRGGNRGNQGGAGGVDAMNLLVGLSQMLSNQQGGGGGGGGGNQGYRGGNQGYNDGGYGGGYQGGNQGGNQGGGNYNRKRRGGDDYSGNYGGKRFNKGGRGRRF